MKSMKRFSVLILIVLLSISFSDTAKAELFGLSVNEGGSDSQLFHINPATAETTLIGNTGFDSCRGLGFHPFTNVLYGSCRRDGDITNVLIMIDRDTGEGTEIGPLNVNGLIRDMSFRSDGVLFAYRSAKPVDTLGTIDLDTGNFNIIGQPGVDGLSPGIAFSPDDTLYAASTDILGTQSLYILDQDTGQASFVRSITGIPLPDTSDFTSLDTRPTDGALFAQYNEFSFGDSFLSTLDTDSGVLTTIGQTEDGTNIFAIAFLNPPPPRPIPTLSQWGLIALSAVILISGAFYLRRRTAS